MRICSATASAISARPWPTLQYHRLAMASINSLPSLSHSSAPFAAGDRDEIPSCRLGERMQEGVGHPSIKPQILSAIVRRTHRCAQNSGLCRVWQGGGVTTRSDPFTEAARRVERGADHHAEAEALVAQMTLEEKLGCLDGDTPFWPGLTDMSGGRLLPPPMAGGGGRAIGHPGHRVRRRTARLCDRRRDRVPREHGPWRDVRPRTGGADRRGDRGRTPGQRRDVHRRRVHEPAPPSRVGPRPGDLRRGSAPRRGDGGRAHPRPAAPRDGMHEALRLELDGERPVHRRRHRRRACARTRCTCRTSSASPPRGSPR